MAQVAFWVAILALVCSSAVPDVSATLTEEEKEELLRAHNHYRGLVDPIATNMIRLEWDDELAYAAQFWAAACEYNLNEERNSQIQSYDYIGQNNGATISYTVNYTIMVQSWFQQGRLYNYYSSACIDEDGDEDEEGEACQNYINLAWSRSYAVGCGVFRCEELAGAEDNNENALYLVCYYGPGQSYYGEPPYQTGSEPCSVCPTDKPYCVGNLCSESGAPPVVSHMSLLGLLVAISAVASLL